MSFIYDYYGPIYRFEKYIGHKRYATIASSDKQAINNIKHQIKRDLGLVENSVVSIDPSLLVRKELAEREKPAPKKEEPEAVQLSMFEGKQDKDKSRIIVKVFVSNEINEKIVSGKPEDKYDEQTLEEWYDFASNVEGIIERQFIVKNISLSKQPESLSEYIDFYRKDEDGNQKEGLVDLRLSDHKSTTNSRQNRKNKVKKLDPNYRLVSVIVNERQFNSYEEALKYIEELLGKLNESLTESKPSYARQVLRRGNIPEDVAREQAKELANKFPGEMFCYGWIDKGCRTKEFFTPFNVDDNQLDILRKTKSIIWQYTKKA